MPVRCPSFDDAIAGVEQRKIANVTRHKNLPSYAAYIRAATGLYETAATLAWARVSAGATVRWWMGLRDNPAFARDAGF